LLSVENSNVFVCVCDVVVCGERRFSAYQGAPVCYWPGCSS